MKLFTKHGELTLESEEIDIKIATDRTVYLKTNKTQYQSTNKQIPKGLTKIEKEIFMFKLRQIYIQNLGKEVKENGV